MREKRRCTAARVFVFKVSVHYYIHSVEPDHFDPEKEFIFRDYSRIEHGLPLKFAWIFTVCFPRGFKSPKGHWWSPWLLIQQPWHLWLQLSDALPWNKRSRYILWSKKVPSPWPRWSSDFYILHFHFEYAQPFFSQRHSLIWSTVMNLLHLCGWWREGPICADTTLCDSDRWAWIMAQFDDILTKSAEHPSTLCDFCWKSSRKRVVGVTKSLFAL